jgi:transcriptional regulator with XRE-family HTH domain
MGCVILIPVFMFAYHTTKAHIYVIFIFDGLCFENFGAKMNVSLRRPLMMNKQIGCNIGKACEFHQVSQNELTEIADVAQSTLSYIDNAIRPLSLTRFPRITAVLNSRILDLFSYNVLKANQQLFEQQKPTNSLNAGILCDELTLETVKTLYEPKEE